MKLSQQYKTLGITEKDDDIDIKFKYLKLKFFYEKQKNINGLIKIKKSYSEIIENHKNLSDIEKIVSERLSVRSLIPNDNALCTHFDDADRIFDLIIKRNIDLNFENNRGESLAGLLCNYENHAVFQFGRFAINLMDVGLNLDKQVLNLLMFLNQCGVVNKNEYLNKLSNIAINSNVFADFVKGMILDADRAETYGRDLMIKNLGKIINENMGVLLNANLEKLNKIVKTCKKIKHCNDFNVLNELIDKIKILNNKEDLSKKININNNIKKQESFI